MSHELDPPKEEAIINKAVYTLKEDAARYRALKARYVGADFSQPSATGQGTRCVLIFEWPEDEPVSKSLDETVDRLRF